MIPITRRHLLSAAASLPAASLLAAQTPRGASRVQPFPLKRVRLLDGICFFLMERNRGYLHALDPNRLLHTFRVTAGLPSSAEPLAGWERPDIELRGHFTGHYLSACAQTYAGAGDEMLKKKADRMVAVLGDCQKANGNGYLSAFPPELFQRLKERLPVWAPWYTVHKIMAGMLDMYRHCGNEHALDILQGMADWAIRWADGINDALMARILEVEFGGMNEVLYNLHAVTGKPQYADLAHRFDHARVFDPLAEGRDELKGLHVNTQIPKIIGAARRYELTGEQRYRRIAEFFWRQVTEHRSYCTGGTSNYERWRTDPGRLASELSNVTQECCCTYNMLKLTRHVFAWNPETRYADYHERAFFNGILGTMNPKDGMTMYYVPLESGYWKMFALPARSFWCCTGSGTESFSKLGDSVFFHDDDGVYVTLFVAARVEWPEKGLFLRQETMFPDQERTRFEFQVRQPVRLALRIRAPYWATRGIAIKVNGEDTATSGRWRTIDRVWNSGDSVEVSMPMSLHAEGMPDDDRVQAFLYGPIVLAGELGREGLTYDRMYGDPNNARGGKYLRGEPVAAPELAGDPGDLASWIAPVRDQPLTFRTSGQARDVTLIPLNRLFEERYAVYWKMRG